MVVPNQQPTQETGSIASTQPESEPGPVHSVRRYRDEPDEPIANLDDVNSDAGTCSERMTQKVVQKLCVAAGLYETPINNRKLFLGCKSFKEINGLEAYRNVQALFLESNCLTKIEGLDRLAELRVLHLHQNAITKISGLDFNTKLVKLDLAHNNITKIENLSQCANLQTFDISSNKIAGFSDMEGLGACPALTSIDISGNLIKEFVGHVEFWSQFTELRALRTHNNPGVRGTPQYRQSLIEALSDLRFLDQRRVTDLERTTSTALVRIPFCLFVLHTYQMSFE